MPYLIEVTDGTGRTLVKESAATEAAAYAAICDATIHIRHFLIRQFVNEHETATETWSPLTVKFENTDTSGISGRGHSSTRVRTLSVRPKVSR